MEKFLFSKIESWVALLIAIILFVLGTAWGFSILQFNAFPRWQIKEISDFFRGELGDHRPVWTRLTAGHVYEPAAFKALANTTLVDAGDLAEVSEEPKPGAILPVTDGFRIFHDGGEKRYFVIYAGFAFLEQEAHWGAILIDTDGVVHRGWPMKTEEYEYHGGHMAVAISDQGILATNTNGVLRATDWCGGEIWRAPWVPHPDGRRRHQDSAEGYDWHHDIAYSNGAFHTFVGPRATSLDAETGEILQSVHPVDLIRWGWTENYGVFDTARPYLFNPKRLTEENYPDLITLDPYHFNKVDVLSEELAPQFDLFEPGDLLISPRNLNIVAVARPSEERIVWWRYGLFSRAHDATFSHDGHIELFSNNPFSQPPQPTIVRLPVDDHRADILFDLSDWKMVMRQRGNFVRIDDRLLTVDHDAGRVIAGRLDGSFEFIFENGFTTDEGETINLVTHDIKEVSPVDFTRFEAQCSS